MQRDKKMKRNDKLSFIIYKYFALGCSSILVESNEVGTIRLEGFRKTVKRFS